MNIPYSLLYNLIFFILLFKLNNYTILYYFMVVIWMSVILYEIYRKIISDKILFYPEIDKPVTCKKIIDKEESDTLIINPLLKLTSENIKTFIKDKYIGDK